jgi:hypothetical protein
MTLKNKLNGEQFVCENIKEVQLIDGVEYIVVHRLNNDRNFLMRKDILEKDSSVKSKDKTIKK